MPSSSQDAPSTLLALPKQGVQWLMQAEGPPSMALVPVGLRARILLVRLLSGRAPGPGPRQGPRFVTTVWAGPTHLDARTEGVRPTGRLLMRA